MRFFYNLKTRRKTKKGAIKIANQKEKIDWEAIRLEYITTDTTYQKLADKYKIRMQTVAERAKNEGWRAERKKHKEKIVKRAVRKSEKKEADRLKRILKAGDRLLAKLEKAINELDIQICKEVEKTKIIEYNNTQRPDKPTKETIEERERVKEYKTIIDRKGLQQLSNALNSLRDVQMIRSAMDLEEQRLRIENLKKQAEKEEEATSITISIEGGEESWQQ